jgi:UDPglucose 6-dehydrogenase
MQRVAVFGAGHVGLVTAACLASLGNDVQCYDTDRCRINDLQDGRLPFYEPGLEQLVRSGLHAKTLRFTPSCGEALDGRTIAFVAVGTPVGAAGEADLTYVRAAARDIARNARRPLIVVGKSTVPVETADLVARLLERHGTVRFSVASNPEFLREGTAVRDFLHPDRIVIGTCDDLARTALEELYAPLHAPLMFVDARTAEAIKYAANSFLATKISFANELANICAAVGADCTRVLEGIAADPRIGAHFLTPGLGFGGSCLPKDLSALAYLARTHGIEPLILQAVAAVNRGQICRAMTLLESLCGDLDGTRIALLGAAFKGGTDDVRESPAIALGRVLLAKGSRLVVSDPLALDNAGRELPGAELVAQAQDACENADAIVVAADWPEYRSLDWSLIAQRMPGRFVLDARRTVDAEAVRKAGLTFCDVSDLPRTKVRAA